MASRSRHSTSTTHHSHHDHPPKEDEEPEPIIETKKSRRSKLSFDNEVHCGCEGRNHYSIKSDKGQEIMLANETTCCCYLKCCFKCCQSSRPFDFKVDLFNGEKLYLDRKCSCNSCFCCCCRNKVIISLSHFGKLGYVTQKCCNVCTTEFKVKDAHGTTEMVIKGPCCNWTRCCGQCCCCGCGECCCDYTFTIEDRSGKKIGRISKKWSGMVQEMLTDADNYGLKFPKELDVRMKACLIGATILIVSLALICMGVIIIMMVCCPQGLHVL